MTTKFTNYVAAWVDYSRNRDGEIMVLERDQDGKVLKVRHNSPFYFFVEDPEGERESIFGHKVTRAEFKTKHEYDEALKFFRNPRNFEEEGRCPYLFETDIQPLKRVLMDMYYNRPSPPVNFVFIDIEADYTRKIGFPSPSNPYAVINAVTVYQSWTQKFFTLAIPPKEFTGTIDDLYAEINELIKQKQLREGIIPEIILCDDERELVNIMLQLIQESDIISGWNSEFFDMPYIYERLMRLGGESLVAKLEHVGCRPPRKVMVNKFGSEEPVIKFSGRSHLDYMRLFQKFTFEGRVSYSLGNILQEEVGVGKIEFEGSLEDLYHNNFPKFVAYNFRDVDGIVQLDAKFKFIALANQMAHENTVSFDAVLGTVSYVETGITNHAHYVLNKVVHDKNIKEHDKVEGAIVLNPKIGLHEWVGSVDINSLYPNTIRSLNISPEKIIGQFTQKEEAWLAIKNNTDDRLCFQYESGKQEILTAKEWKTILVDRHWAVSAYGTVFDQSNGRGVVADILGFWYAERKRLQAEKKKYTALAKEEKDPVKKAEYKKLEEHYDLLQLTKKISMNSLYGALLNPSMRFSDERMGASVTATGRQITTHMMETIAFLLTGERSPLKKHTEFDEEEGKYINIYTCDSPAIIYGDTDSVDKDSVIDTSLGKKSIESLFDTFDIKRKNYENKEFAFSSVKVTTPCYVNKRIVQRPILAIYRHKVSKKKYKITLENEKSVIVTEDHSVMVIRDGVLTEIKPKDINTNTDLCISVDDMNVTNNGDVANYELVKIRAIEELEAFDNEYVYDVIMADDSTPWFFANGVLVHNSCYYKCIGATDKASAIEIADLTAEGVNDSFPAFMREAFNCQPEFDTLIKAGREIVGSRGLFQAKKKYIIKVIDAEGLPVDKLKSMGSEIKKADTPKIIQDFLKTTVDMILDGKSYDELAEYVNGQRREILKKKVNVFSLGVAKQVNNLEKYMAEYRAPGTFRSKNGGKLTIPGHARAACNYNALLEEFDKGAKPIKSGDKVLVYYLKKNDRDFKSIAFPAEFTRFPDWFTENFQVDIKKTEERMFDSKLSGMFAAAFNKEVPTPQSVLTNSLLEF
jgi:DNA polymerase elongation subunit (family B)